MATSYKKLFKLLIDRDIKKKELAEKASISIAAIIKMGKDGGVISSEILVKICTALDCTMDHLSISLREAPPILLWKKSQMKLQI